MIRDINGALLKTEIPELKLINRGKVRDIYDTGEHLLFVATDRISAFDVVMPNGIPGKGRILTQISLFWFKLLDWMPNHLVSADCADLPGNIARHAKDLDGRFMLVKKASTIPVECIVRGYLVGSGWKDYISSGSVCGINIREGYFQAEKLDEPLFTPSTKAEQGEHDENISFEKAAKIVGAKTAAKIKELSIHIYSEAATHAEKKGIILADTKFEFGLLGDQLLLIDEVLTPDSSRFWPADKYQPGRAQNNFDKQYVRDWLESVGFNKKPPAPRLPAEVIAGIRARYLEALARLSGRGLG